MLLLFVPGEMYVPAHGDVPNRIKFNANRCKVLHVGENTQKYKYSMGDNWLGGSIAQQDLGVFGDSASQQCERLTKIAKAILVCIKRSIR